MGVSFSLADDAPRPLSKAGLCMCEEFMVCWFRTEKSGFFLCCFIRNLMNTD